MDTTTDGIMDMSSRKESKLLGEERQFSEIISEINNGGNIKFVLRSSS